MRERPEGWRCASRSAAVLTGLVVVVGSLVGAVRAHADQTPSGAAPDASGIARRSLLGRRDLAFALGTTAAVVIAAQSDASVRSEVLENPGSGRALARTLEHLGNPGVVAPSLLAIYGVAWLRHDHALTSAMTEIGLSVAATGVEVLALKEAAGRARPSSPLRDGDDIRPFSGNASFPSGHTAVAFALAEAIDRTSGRHWMPWLTIPVAAAVGWSRIRDQEHWISDVVAGAALGEWTARKIHQYRASDAGRARLGFDLVLPPHGIELGLTVR